LAADLQRAQLSGSAQRLSERNCIEIVYRLVELKLLDVIHTTDGKEYLTPNELGKEIREELIVHRGRINLVDLQQTLNVDLSHIEAKVGELIKNDRNLTLILGQLIDRSYLDAIGEEIDDKLQENGIVTIAELAKLYDLPGDFINEVVRSRLGHAIKGHIDDLDRNVIYTEAYVARYRAKICGLFSGVTKPTPVQPIVNRYGLQNRLFHSIMESLISSGRLSGSLTGGRQETAVYVPNIYTKSQNDWVDAFYKQNGYLEYDAVSRLGITDAKSFIKKRFKTEQIEYLGSCCVGQLIRDQIESEVEEALSANTWTDIMPLLPSICSRHDAHQLLTGVVRHRPKAVIFCDSIVTNEAFLSSCAKPFESLINAKAEKAVKEKPSLLLTHLGSSSKRPTSSIHHPAAPTGNDVAPQHDDKNDTGRKKKPTGGKGGGSGGGQCGREIKTKSASKKKVAGGRDRDVTGANSDDEVSKSQESSELDFMSIEELSTELGRQPTLAECSQEFIDAVASHLYRPLTREFGERLKSVFLQTMQGGTGGAGSGAVRKARGDMAEKISGLWINAKLFEKGLKLFDDDLQSQLCRHLLKTIGTDVVNTVFGVYAADTMLPMSDDKELGAEGRMKLIAGVADDKAKSVLGNLHKSLNAKTTDEFFAHVETICSTSFLDINLRKPDKKKERQLVFNHRQSLAEQLRQETDIAMALHISAVLLVQIHTQCMVHAPGRCIPLIIAYLKQHLPADQHSLLVECQELVMKRLKLLNDLSTTSPVADEDNSTVSDGDICRQLGELLPKVKDIALNAKRPAAGAVDE
jgi:hypothetical protein